MGWYTKGAEAGLPKAMHNIGIMLEEGRGVAAADCRAAANWYRRTADAGHAGAANNLSILYTLGRGRAWQIVRATSLHSRPSTFRPSFLESNCIIRHGEQYLLGFGARRHT